MALSPQERLRKLEERILEKEEEREKLQEEEEQTEQELKQAHRALEDELKELRAEREIQQLQQEIAALEAQGRTDAGIIAELSRRGVQTRTIRQAIEAHEDHTGHEHSLHAALETSLEERVGGSSGERREEERAVAYRSEQQQTIAYQAQGREQTYQGPQHSIGPDEQYSAIEQFEQNRRDQESYQAQGPLRPNEDLVESIQHATDLRIGGRYLRQDQ